MERLILWDVDGTLLSTAGVAAEAMRAAIREVVGATAPLARTAYAGKTDWQIIRESLPTLAPAEISARLHEFAAAYLARLEAQREALVARSQLFPGVAAILAALGGAARQAPLTGNLAAVARLKLECVGLLPFLTWRRARTAMITTTGPRWCRLRRRGRRSATDTVSRAVRWLSSAIRPTTLIAGAPMAHAPSRLRRGRTAWRSCRPTTPMCCCLIWRTPLRLWLRCWGSPTANLH